MHKIITNSEKETFKFGKYIAAKLKKGDVIVLSGELGSGKTKLTEGILAFFKLQDEISSPTFTIVNEYNSQSVNIFHFDVYRLEDEDEFYAIGGEEYFSKGICIIEWGEKISNVLPKNYIKINFYRDYTNENKRILEVDLIGNTSIRGEYIENFKC